MKNRKALISSLNIYSLKKHHPDLKTSAKITTSEVVCVQETWIEPNQDDTNKYQIPEFKVHFNSVGRGKGIATYFSKGFYVQEDVVKPNYQMTKIASVEREIINVYRSSNAPVLFLDDLLNLINCGYPTYIIGDFNICYKSERDNKIIRKLEELGFR